MIRNECLIFLPIFLAEYSNEVLDILWVVLHLTRVVPFHGEGDAKLYVVEVDLRIVIKDVLVEDLADTRVVTVKELDHFHGGVDEYDDEYTERYDAANHGVNGRLAL